MTDPKTKECCYPQNEEAAGMFLRMYMICSYFYIGTRIVQNAFNECLVDDLVPVMFVFNPIGMNDDEPDYDFIDEIEDEIEDID